MTFQIVPRGTPGAISLRQAMEIRLRELGLHICTPELRDRLRERTKASWKKGKYAGVPVKTSAALLDRHGKKRGEPR